MTASLLNTLSTYISRVLLSYITYYISYNLIVLLYLLSYFLLWGSWRAPWGYSLFTKGQPREERKCGEGSAVRVIQAHTHAPDVRQRWVTELCYAVTSIFSTFLKPLQYTALLICSYFSQTSWKGTSNLPWGSSWLSQHILSRLPQPITEQELLWVETRPPPQPITDLILPWPWPRMQQRL